MANGKKSAQARAHELNEKATYHAKSDEWKRLRVRGDIEAIAGILGKSPMLISRAVNKGQGSLFVLREVNKYFDERKQALGGKYADKYQKASAAND
jgi:hypothetical protein